MSLFIQTIADGLLTGGIYALIALGLTLQHALAINIGTDNFQDDYIIQDIDSAISLCAGLVVLSTQSNTVHLARRAEGGRSWLSRMRTSVNSAGGTGQGKRI